MSYTFFFLFFSVHENITKQSQFVFRNEKPCNGMRKKIWSAYVSASYPLKSNKTAVVVSKQQVGDDTLFETCCCIH